jgi:predicted small secreted protein
MHILNKVFLISLLLGVTAFMAGCNTISGIGEDLQAAGRAIEDTAEEVKEGDD